ncbi:MAG: DNA mismatch repair endonuclease MutL [Candidatus Melainabacteria bacterium]
MATPVLESLSTTAPAEIRVLPPHVVNHIAAGEVVDRPAAVVKELVENAIDAGATRVEIAAGNGGRTLRVADNGHGMTEDNARKAFLNHATSKIRTEEDLTRLHTLGFRGEALASVSAIARVACTTRTHTADAGFRFTPDPLNPENSECTPAGCAPGTTMQIDDLFYNVPARLKFLKRPQTELAYIEEAVQSLALAHPEIRFTLSLNDKPVLATTGSGDLKTTIAEIFHTDKTPLDLVAVDWQDDTAGYRLQGFVSSPGVLKGNRRWMHHAINQRVVQCPVLRRAVEAAYESLIPPGKFPVTVLFLTWPTDEVDVNVHPTKKEVRYTQNNTVFSFVRTAIQRALTDHGYVAQHFQAAPPPTGAGFQDATPFTRETPTGSFQNSGTISGPPRWQPHPQNEPQWRQGSLQAGMDAYRPLTAAEPLTGAETPAPQPLTPGDTASAGPPYRVVGQLFNTYILLETVQGLMVVDQHIASERELFEALSQSIRGEEPPIQQLITPMVLLVSPAQLSLLGLSEEAFGRLGFAYTLDIPQSVARVTGIPLVYAHRTDDPRALFEHLLAQLEDTGEMALDLDHLIATLACHSAVRAGDVLSHTDMQRVVAGWLRARLPWTCPHGRPIAHTIRAEELNKFFDRPSLPVNAL